MLRRFLLAAALLFTPLASAQTITLLFPQEPGSLFPHFDLLSIAHEAQNLVFERLFVIGPNGEYIPHLAAEVPTLANGGLSDDGRTVTIRLREGITWQDGAPLTSADVAFTHSVIVNPDLPIPTRTVWRDIEAIDTPDALTAVIRFAAPNVSFLGAASFAGAYILPRHLLEGQDLANADFHRNPVGSGPFRFVEWQAGSFLRFERHDGYWGESAGVDEVIVRIVPGGEAQRALLQRGEADLVLQVALTELPFIRSLADYRVVNVPTFANWQIWLNNEDPALSDVRVRRALQHALDRPLIAQALLGGLVEPHDAILPPNHWAYEPGVQATPYDVAEAERLLDEAGWRRASAGAIRTKDGAPLRVEITNIAGQADRAQVVQAVQSFWRAVGVQAEVREIDAASFPPTLSGGEYQAAYGFFGEAQEPVWNLWLGTNWQRYGNAEALDLLRTYGATIDRDARRALAQEFQKQAAVDLPVLILAARPLIAVAGNALEGFDPTTTSSLWNVGTWRK